MIRGIYTSASALRAATLHQGRLSHNLANIHTTGFKQVLTLRQAYQVNAMGRYSADGADYLERLGNLEQGLMVPDHIVDFSQGTFESTERPFDLAVEGNGFFRVQTPEGERYTRDGSFHRDTLGQLVTRDGFYVLGADGAPIVLPAGLTSILPDGAIFVNNEQVAQIGLADVADPNDWVQENNNLFSTDAAAPLEPNTVSIKQGYLELSNVEENVQIVEMMRILRLYEANQRTLQTQDRALGAVLMVGEL
jgi:flagellar basal-body rod protein FlgF